MPDLAVSNDTEIIAKVQKTAEILMIFKVHTYGEQTVVPATFDDELVSVTSRLLKLKTCPQLCSMQAPAAGTDQQYFQL